MPIVNARMTRGDYQPRYLERELTRPVDLCDRSGRLNPDAVGWARAPLVRGNLVGHWARKKKWNFWNWICPRFVFSITLADVDFAAFCTAAFTDFETGATLSGTVLTRPHAFAMPEHVDDAISFRGGGMTYTNAPHQNGTTVRFEGHAKDGTALEADFQVHRPLGHESLTVVVPWTPSRFQLNCKENTRPCEGFVRVGERRYTMDPADCHGVQDFGRGVWPHRSFWNWGVCTGIHDGRRIGVNVGGKWTTGTGSNENALCIDGRLHKIMEDLAWAYDPDTPMAPWHVRAEHSQAIDLTLQPIFVHSPNLNLGVLRTGGVCAFGRWSGAIRAGGEAIEISGLIGWAEEFSHRW